MRIGIVTAVAAATLSLAAIALVTQPWQVANAQGDLVEAVKARQKAMKDNSAIAKELGAFFKEGKGTAEEMADKAHQLVEVAKVIPSVFPEGTSLEQQLEGIEENRAKPDIWQNWSEFEAAAAKLGTEAAKLEELLEAGDKEAAAAQFAVVGKQGCGGCHQTFRAPEA